MSTISAGLLLATLALYGHATYAELQVPDDHGNRVVLASPARRIVILAPHAAELACAAGAGDHIVGTVRGSDYPAALRGVPSVGDGTLLDVERIVALRPDLVIAWQTAPAAPLAAVLQQLDIPLYYSDPQTLAAIPTAIERMGQLFGTQPQAKRVAAALRSRLEVLQSQYSQRPPVKVFIQVGREPLFTLNHTSILSNAVALCGGINVFGNATFVAPQVTWEAVLAAQPQAVLAGVSGPVDNEANIRFWQGMGLPAAAAGHIFSIEADILYRPTPRLIDATEQVVTRGVKMSHFARSKSEPLFRKVGSFCARSECCTRKSGWKFMFSRLRAFRSVR